jgi:hypothetical protein
MAKSTLIRLCESRRPQLTLPLLRNHELSGGAKDLTLIIVSLCSSLWHLASSRCFRK